MTDKTETPLTDEAEFGAEVEEYPKWGFGPPYKRTVYVVDSDVARQLERTLRESQKALRRYGDHDFDCNVNFPETVEPCNCGFDAALPQPESQDEGGNGQ